MTSDQQRVFLETISGLFDGTLAHDDERAVNFAQQLVEDPDASALFLEFATLDVDLQWLCNLGESAQPQFSLSAGRIDSSSSNPAVSVANTPVTTVPAEPREETPLLGFLGRARAAFRRPAYWSVLAAGLLFAGYFVAVSWNMLGRHLPNGTDGNEMTVATIRETADVEWSADKSETRNPKSEITANQPLSITAGLIELELKQGTTLLIEGPADWHINGENSATLNRGKLVAKVPKQAVGFTLETPTAKIIDLGTEFEVVVERHGVTNVQVTKGKIQVAPASSHPDGAHHRILFAGEQQQVGATGFVGDVVADRSRVTHLSRSPPKVTGTVLVEQGGQFAEGNLATRTVARAFAVDAFQHRDSQWQHQISYLNDGRYGNEHSWIGATGNPMFAGINLGGNFRITSIAFGRDNEAKVRDRYAGTYTLQITTVESPDKKTADSAWTTIGTITHGEQESEYKSGIFKPYLRHRYEFAPVEATGVRLLVPTNAAIDEIEVYESPLPTAESANPSPPVTKP